MRRYRQLHDISYIIEEVCRGSRDNNAGAARPVTVRTGFKQPTLKEIFMAGRNFLFVPGPTNVPDRVLRAMVVSMEDHRSPVFPELSRACLNALKPIFKTTSASPIIFPSSGTGCWEAALTNCLNPGDKVLTSRFGQFSHLWADMCTRLGFEVELLETPWGDGAPVERYLSSLKQDKQHK